MSTPTLPLLDLSEEELELFQLLQSELIVAGTDLQLYDAYYRGEQLVRDLGISIPPQLRGLRTVIGWPGIAVDRVEERLDIEGFRYADSASADNGINEIWAANQLDLESQLAHLDALVYGHCYICAGTGDFDGDLPIITVESPTQVTVLYDARVRAIVAALRMYDLDNTPDTPPTELERAATLYLPNQTISLIEGVGVGVGWEIVDRDQHGLGVVPVFRMSNRQRIADRRGSSDITEPIMSITDAACRRLMGIEVAAEFFGAPQRYILGAAEEAFQSADGKPKSAWETYIGRILALERDEDGSVPEVGQFAAHDPSSQTAIVDMYARIMSAHTGLPPQYFGYSTDNPASADAIRAGESSLIKKAERRQKAFGAVWARVMRLALWLRDGVPPDPGRRIETVWRNAATPTVAAQTDAAVKLVQAGILPPDSDVVLDMVGLSHGQRRRVASERRRGQGRELIRSLTRPIPQPTQGRQPVEANAAGEAVQ